MINGKTYRAYAWYVDLHESGPFFSIWTNFVTEDMTAIGPYWDGWSLELTIDAGLVGQIFQIGF